VEAESGVRLPQVPDEPLGYWIDRVTVRARLTLIVDQTRVIEDAATDNNLRQAEEMLDALWSGLRRRRHTSEVLQMGDVASEVLTAHDLRRVTGTMSGIPFGLPYLDVISDGAQPGDTVAIVGRPGTGKTYLCLNCANQAYDFGEVPLIVSMEMSPQQCVRRILALRSGVPASLIRLGRLSFWGREQLLAEVSHLREVRGERPFYIFKGSLDSTVEDLESWVRDLRPTVLYVDGAYLLRSKRHMDKRWERVTYTAEFLKSLADHFAIPVVETYQFNRRGPGRLGNIAYSDAIPQLASIVLSLTDEDRGRRRTMSWGGTSYKMVELLKGREGERGRFRLLFDMNRMVIREDAVVEGMEEGMQTLADEEGADG
jgi:replicative DNA helicase